MGKFLFERDAQDHFIKWRNSLVETKRQFPSKIKGFVPKIVGAAARFAGALHCIHKFSHGGVPGPTMAKVDVEIARRYSELVPDRELGQRVFTAIKDELNRTSDALQSLTGQTERLTDNPSLARSIAHRFPYIAPLNHLQVELLRRWRAGDTDEKARRGLLISINGVSAGLRNTG